MSGKADVRKDRVVTIDYKLTDENGKLLDSSEETGPLAYLHGHKNIVPGLEKALEGLEPGAQKTVEVAAADGYGERDDSQVIELPRQQLPDDAFVGAVVHGQLAGGQVVMLTVVELDDDKAKLDANHPLAGHDLVFDVTIVKVEKATEEELAHGHAHH
ncbi:MAG: peptidylprolyl isomerase [Deltaproteobacteria bacterium]|nr:peptidylprolyl isomerase [Deltaproteobacteria bacterium]MBW2535523.1 peptidylprolyl isomerase [Deltaproteobacteria bacterium]